MSDQGPEQGAKTYLPSTVDIGSVLICGADRSIVGLTPGAADEALLSSGPSPALPAYGPVAAGGGALSAAPSVSVYNTTVQSIASGAFTTLAFNSERFDTDGFHDTATNNSRLTVPAGKAGKYLIGAHVEFSVSATGNRVIALRLNGSALIALQSTHPEGTDNSQTSVVRLFDLAEGDYVEVQVYQTSGASRDINVSTAPHAWSPEFWMVMQAGGGGAGGVEVFAPAGPKTPIVDADFTWRNQGSSSYTISARDESVCLRIPANADNICRGRDKALPATPFTVIANIRQALHSFGNPGCGLYVYDTTATQAWLLYVVYVGGYQVHVFGPTGAGMSLASGSSVLSFNSWKPPEFIAIHDDGTNRKYYVGEDEEHMIEVYSHARGTSITPDRIGFFGSPRNSNGIDLVATVMSWHEQAGAPL